MISLKQSIFLGDCVVQVGKTNWVDDNSKEILEEVRRNYDNR